MTSKAKRSGAEIPTAAIPVSAPNPPEEGGEEDSKKRKKIYDGATDVTGREKQALDSRIALAAGNYSRFASNTSLDAVDGIFSSAMAATVQIVINGSYDTGRLIACLDKMLEAQQCAITAMRLPRTYTIPKPEA
jgi:hypothetical protein